MTIIVRDPKFIPFKIMLTIMMRIYIYSQLPLYQKPDITKYPLIAKCDISPRVLNAFIFIRL